MAQIAAAVANSSSSAAAEAALWANYTAIYHAALTEVLWNQVAKWHLFAPFESTPSPPNIGQDRLGTKVASRKSLTEEALGVRALRLLAC